MCSLHGFSTGPPVGHVTLCEMEGRVHSMPVELVDGHNFTHIVSTFFIGILS
jgi:hypothetical protein